MSELELLLAPWAPAEFFRDCWDRKAVHIPGAADKFAAIYDAQMWANFEGVTDLKAVTTDGSGVQVETPALPQQAGILFVNGFTICADVSNAPRLAPFLRGFRAQLEMGGGPAFAKLYASNDGKGFSVHADSHHVFVLQISGKKLWRYSRTPVVPSPSKGIFMRADGQPYWTDGHNREPAARDDGTPVGAPDPETFDSALLEPGHCLYLPPGTWHVARAVGHSIAVSISPQRGSATDVFMNAIHDLIADRPEWRQDLIAPPGEAREGGAAPASVAARIDARLADLRALLAGLDARHLHRQWMRDAAPETTVEAGPPVNAGGPQEVRRSTVFERADDQPFHFLVAPVAPGAGDRDEDRCYFFGGQGGPEGGQEWSLPLSARALLTEVARQQRFRAEDALGWDRKLRFDDVRAVLSLLVSAGILRQR